MESVHDASVFSSVLFVTLAAMLAGAAISLLPGLGMSQIDVPRAKPLALALMVLAFSGVLVTTLLNLPDTMRQTLLVLCATALLCSGFAVLMGWFAVSGAGGRWL
jgi:phosphatidylserine synthase